MVHRLSREIFPWYTHKNPEIRGDVKTSHVYTYI